MKDLSNHSWGFIAYTKTDKLEKNHLIHYFSKTDKESICETGYLVDHPIFNKHKSTAHDVFLTREKSLELGYRLCPICVSRKRNFSRKISPVENIGKNDEYLQIQTECPNCQSKVCFYSNGIHKEHLCTECNELVEVPMGISC